MFMEIGTKIKNARNESGFSQEQAAEALGVSRQTISNWENEKTYPDIVSVVKMSDLYSISLDHLLKEEIHMKQTYTEYLEESTNIVKSKNRVAKIVLISVFLFVFAMSEIVLWLFAPNSQYGAVFNIIFFYTLLPITIFIVSLIVGKNDFWGKAKWFLAFFFGIMTMLVPYSSFDMLSETEGCLSFTWPNFWALPFGIGISLLGLVIGSFFGSNQRKKSI